MAYENRSRRPYQPEPKRIRSNSTGVEVERRDLMRAAGAREDRGQSLTDLRTAAAGTLATPESPAMAALKARNPGATPWQPGGAGAAAPFRGSTGDEVANFQAGANPGAVAAATGQKVATPHGTVGVRFAQPGEVQGAIAGDQSTGPKHGAALNWQQALVQKYPQLGVAGSPENLEFVRAHKAAQAAGSNVDPQAMAETVINNIRSPKPVAELPKGIAEAQIADPTPLFGEQKPAEGVNPPMFAGAPVGATPWSPITPPSPAKQAGESFGPSVKRAASLAATATGLPLLGKGMQTATRGVASGVKGIADFASGAAKTSGLVAGKPTPPAPGAMVQTPSVPATDFPLTDPKKLKGASAFAFQ